jgi:hypothetical protein
MKCPKDGAKITSKHYDADYEIYECPKCGEAFAADDLEEAENGTSPRMRRELAQIKKVPQAKGKKRLTEIAADEEAIAAFEAKSVVVKKGDAPVVKHRDSVATGDLLDIIADEIQLYSVEMGGQEIDRLNAREFFAMNLVRPLLSAGVNFREKEVSRAYCKEHRG